MSHHEIIDKAFRENAELAKRVHDAMRTFAKAKNRSQGVECLTAVT